MKPLDASAIESPTSKRVFLTTLATLHFCGYVISQSSQMSCKFPEGCPRSFLLQIFDLLVSFPGFLVVKGYQFFVQSGSTDEINGLIIIISFFAASMNSFTAACLFIFLARPMLKHSSEKFVESHRRAALFLSVGSTWTFLIILMSKEIGRADASFIFLMVTAFFMYSLVRATEFGAKKWNKFRKRPST